VIEVKYVPVFTIRLPFSASGIVVAGNAQIALDSRAPRELMVRLLEETIKQIKVGHSPDQIARQPR
jgi:hypothetical protein